MARLKKKIQRFRRKKNAVKAEVVGVLEEALNYLFLNAEVVGLKKEIYLKNALNAKVAQNNSNTTPPRTSAGINMPSKVVLSFYRTNKIILQSLNLYYYFWMG